MDPICHTFVGAALAETGLKRRSAGAAAALVIGANLPDIDGVATLLGGDGSLYWRRGWSHGIPALIVLPFLLAVAMVWWQRWRGRGDEVRPGWLLGLSMIAVWSHPSLDWLNTYGMRWLMPLDGPWFYGDTLFVVDPWMWTLLGGALFLRHSRTMGSLVAWGAYLSIFAALFFLVVPGLAAAKTAWGIAIGALVVLRRRGAGRDVTAARRWALVATALASAYVLASIALARTAESRVERELRGRGLDVERLMVGPIPGTPFVRDVVAEVPGGYRYGRVHLWPGFRLEMTDPLMPELPDTAVVRAATASPSVRGFMNWARFPFAEVERRPGGYTVHLMDARYTRRRGAGFGSARVELDDDDVEAARRAPTPAP